MNVTNGGIALSIDHAKFNVFTQQDYSTIIEKMGSKDFKISQDDVKKMQEKTDNFANITLNVE